ncbi:MAG: hypothetical protein WCC06_07870 [Candidatus Aminicenantales bacterium]
MLFAAAALRWLGHRPLVVDIRARNDDDHVIAVFMTNKRWGAIAKSNFTTLRFREPVYKSIRELIMSYFDFYYNTLGEKTLRSYSLPFDLRRFDDRHWMTTDEDLEYIGSHLNQIRHFKAITPRMARLLHKVDKDVSRAGLFGSNKFGLFRPKRK